MMQRPIAPKCKCEERRAALARAKEADARGDTEAAQAERDFVKQSMVDEAKVWAEYLQQLQAWLVDRTFRRNVNG